MVIRTTHALTVSYIHIFLSLASLLFHPPEGNFSSSDPSSVVRSPFSFFRFIPVYLVLSQAPLTQRGSYFSLPLSLPPFLATETIKDLRQKGREIEKEGQ